MCNVVSTVVLFASTSPYVYVVFLTSEKAFISINVNGP